MHAACRIEEGGDAGVGGADEFWGCDAVGGLLLAFVEKVEEEAVEGTGWGSVSYWCGMSCHFGAGVCGVVACYRITSAVYWATAV